MTTKVEQLITALENAWSAGNGAAWAANFTEDAEFVDALGRVQRGRKVIAREHQKLFDTVYRGSRIEMRQLGCRTLGEDLLLLHTESTLRVDSGPRAGQWPAIMTNIVRAGQILAFQNTMRSDVAEFAAGDRGLAEASPLDWPEH